MLTIDTVQLIFARALSNARKMLMKSTNSNSLVHESEARSLP
jgi:hypothetical protein